MRLKPINESVLDLVDDKMKDMIVADAGLVLSDEIANKDAEREQIKKEMQPVMDNSKKVSKETNGEDPAEILESVTLVEDVDSEEGYKKLVKMLKALKELNTTSNEDFVRAAKEAVRN